jgi:hypothetical protein
MNCLAVTYKEGMPSPEACYSSIQGGTMDNSKMSNRSTKSLEEEFVVMNNNETTNQTDKASSALDKKVQAEFIEYTDGVAEQMRALYEKINTNLEEFFQGNHSIISVNQKMKHFYRTIKEYCFMKDIFDNDNKAYKSKLLKDIYRCYRYNTVMSAVKVNTSEGRKKVEQSSIESIENVENYIYYNSNYYYECETLREALTEMVGNLAKEEGILPFNTETIDRRRRYIYDYGFNYAWFWSNQLTSNWGLDMNKCMIPPKDMEILYVKQISQSEIGKLLIQYEELKIELELDERLAEKYESKSLLDFVKSKEVDLGEQGKIEDFLSAFHIIIK